jgi:hypothetical protein
MRLVGHQRRDGALSAAEGLSHRRSRRRRPSHDVLPTPQRRPDEDYLENLRRGGWVAHGGAFLALPLATEIGLEDSAMTLYHDPSRGRGLAHFALDEFLRRLSGVSGRPRKTFDGRFDVVLSRIGPAPPPPPQPGTSPSPRPRAGVQGEAVLPGIGKDDPLFETIASSARQAQEQLADLLPPSLSRARRTRLVKSLLRQRVHVRLDDGVLRIRFPRPFRKSTAALLQSVFDRYNEQRPGTLGWMSFPMRFELGE